MTLLELLQAALDLHRRGDLPGAIALYDRVLKADPAVGDARMGRGVARLSNGDPQGAAEDFAAVTAIRPSDPAGYSNLGVALARQGKHQQAVDSYDRALELAPTMAAAYGNRGDSQLNLGHYQAAIRDLQHALSLQPGLVAARKGLARAYWLTGQSESAAEAYVRAIQLTPTDPVLYFELGLNLTSLERWDEALGAFEAHLAFGPASADAHCRRADVLTAGGRYAEASQGYRAALAVDDRLAMAHCGLGQALEKLERDQEALASCDRALQLDPDLAQAHTNRAVVLRNLGRCDEALAACDRAVALHPNAVTHTNRGAALHDCGRFSEALAVFEKAINLDSALTEAHKYKGFTELILGDHVNGWREFEWRKRGLFRHGVRLGVAPEWSGVEDLRGKILFVYGEQGLGDSIQFCRLLANVQALGADLIFSCQDALRPLMASLDTPVELIGEASLPARSDYSAALMSLPGLLGIGLDRPPGPLPYLHADPERVARWRERLGGGFKIGVSWKGSPAGIRIGKAFGPDHLSGIASLPGVRLISLQKSESASGAMAPVLEDLGPGLDSDGAFLDTAAVMENLDLVISTDTSIAHLAGALGRPVWVALKHVPDWRWLTERSDSPWYPTMKLFRRDRTGGWDEVFTRMEAELSAWLQDPEMALI